MVTTGESGTTPAAWRVVPSVVAQVARLENAVVNHPHHGVRPCGWTDWSI